MNGLRCECCIIGACYSLSGVHYCKNKHSDLYEMGAKSFVMCCYENETHNTVFFSCTRFKQGERVFFCESPIAALPCGRPPGRGGEKERTPVYGLHRYVPRDRVWFLRSSIFK